MGTGDPRYLHVGRWFYHHPNCRIFFSNFLKDFSTKFPQILFFLLLQKNTKNRKRANVNKENGNIEIVLDHHMEQCGTKISFKCHNSTVP